jgi:hypothetical protein
MKLGAIQHVAIYVVACPFCLAPKGTACKVMRGSGVKHSTGVHMARVLRWNVVTKMKPARKSATRLALDEIERRFKKCHVR